MTPPKLIAVHHVEVRGRRIEVQFTRNPGGSVAGRAVLGAKDTPILDGPDPEAVLTLFREVLEGALLARN